MVVRSFEETLTLLVQWNKNQIWSLHRSIVFALNLMYIYLEIHAWICNNIFPMKPHKTLIHTHIFCILLLGNKQCASIWIVKVWTWNWFREETNTETLHAAAVSQLMASWAHHLHQHVVDFVDLCVMIELTRSY